MEGTILFDYDGSAQSYASNALQHLNYIDCMATALPASLNLFRQPGCPNLPTSIGARRDQEIREDHKLSHNAAMVEGL